MLHSILHAALRPCCVAGCTNLLLVLLTATTLCLGLFAIWLLLLLVLASATLVTHPLLLLPPHPTHVDLLQLRALGLLLLLLLLQDGQPLRVKLLLVKVLLLLWLLWSVLQGPVCLWQCCCRGAPATQPCCCWWHPRLKADQQHLGT
jgi:hypothetical protein